MKTEENSWIQMRNPEGINRFDQVSWDPLALDKYLWIHPDEFQALLERLKITSAIHIRSLRLNTQAREDISSSATSETLVASQIQQKRKNKPKLGSIAFDREEDVAHIFIDTTRLVELIEGSGERYSQPFLGQYGSELDKLVKSQVRKVALGEFFSTLDDKMEKEKIIDRSAFILAISAEVLYIFSMVVAEIIFWISQENKGSALPLVLVSLLPTFLLFYMAGYKALGSTFDVASKNTKDSSKSEAFIAYWKNLFSRENFPTFASIIWISLFLSTLLPRDSVIVGSKTPPSPSEK